jgi:hypothetical protein
MPKKGKKEAKEAKSSKATKQHAAVATEDTASIPASVKSDEKPKPAAQALPPCCLPPAISAKNASAQGKLQRTANEHDLCYKAPVLTIPSIVEPANIDRLPPNFELFSATKRHSHDMLIRRSKKDSKVLFYLSMQFDRYDPLPNFILSRVNPRGTYLGVPPSAGPIATATWPKPPFNTGLDWDIRMYDPKKPPQAPDDRPLLHEKVRVIGPSKHSSSVAFDYQFPETNTKEQFKWILDTGLRGFRRGMKLVRCSTGQAVAKWMRDPDGYINPMSEMTFVDRGLGAQFELLAFMCLVAHKYNPANEPRWDYYNNESRRYDYDKPYTSYWYF